MANSTFAGNNVSSSGGGLINSGALTVTNSTFSGNSATMIGGGLDSYGTLNVANSTFAGNSASDGGGIRSGSGLTVMNSTFSGNRATNSGGGLDSNLGSSLVMTNSTFAGNSAASGGGIYNVANWNMMRSTLFTNSTGGNCSGNTLNGANNLADDATCGSSFTNSTSILLGALGNYGGNTETIPLLPGSPAIGAASANCPATDQRGVARSATCDIGAFESQGFMLTKAGGDNQSAGINTAFVQPLAISVTSAFSEPVDGGAITFAGPLSGASTNPITNTATITAGGAVSQSVTANGMGGLYPVTASATGATSVNFALTNNVSLTYVITPTAGANGRLTPGTPQTVNYGASRAFTVTPNTGYHILDVGVDSVSIGVMSAYTFTNVTANHTITAVFAINTYTLTIATVGGGSVAPNVGTHAYTYGAVVPITATPAASWYFGQWSGDASGIVTQTTVTLDADKVVTATFLTTPPTYYTLTMGLVGNGVITPTAGTHSYVSGTVVDLGASPAAGWQFAGWSGDATGAVNPVTVTMSADKAVTATFNLVPITTYTLMVTTTGTGSGAVVKSPDAISYTAGTVVSLTAVPSATSVFAGWSGAATGLTSSVTVTMNAAKQVTATFTLKSYQLFLPMIRR